MKIQTKEHFRRTKEALTDTRRILAKFKAKKYQCQKCDQMTYWNTLDDANLIDDYQKHVRKLRRKIAEYEATT